MEPLLPASLAGVLLVLAIITGFLSLPPRGNPTDWRGVSWICFLLCLLFGGFVLYSGHVLR